MLSIDTPSEQTNCNEPELIELPQTAANLGENTEKQELRYLYLLEGNLVTTLLNL
jgi:hypothetical protein